MKAYNFTLGGIDYSNALVLQNIDDLIEYQKIGQDQITEIGRILLKSLAEPDEWEEVLSGVDKGPGLSIWWQCVEICKLQGGNPVFQVGQFFGDHCRALYKSVIEDEGVVAINSKGGYFPISKESFENTEATEVDGIELVDRRVKVIKENTKVLNLENDPELEVDAVAYMESVDPNYSYICNMRSFSFDDMVEVFEEFIAKGGDYVYLYTTGMDVKQMYEYTGAMKKAGIMKIKFYWTADNGIDQREFVQESIDDGYDVEVLNN